MTNFRDRLSSPAILTAALLSALGASARGQAPASKPLPDDRRAGAEAVTEQQCREWLGTLASPEFEGRGTGQPGFQKAADFVAAHFRSLSLDARDDKGAYFQHVPWAATKLHPEKTFVTFSKDGKEWTATKRVLAEGEWLWRVTWHDGKCYGVSYNAAQRDTKDAATLKKTAPLAPKP